MTAAAQTPKPLSVGAITRLIKGSLEDQFTNLWIEGEISNFTRASSGHLYFKLKDDQAILPAVMWRSLAEKLRFQPESGQRVLVHGDITVYEKGGYYQLMSSAVLPVGIGPLELAYRQLYERLAKEGLFDDDRKQPLPPFPKHIGLVTSPTGAAVHDFLQIARRRNDLIEIIIAPAKVQGEGSAESIAAAIEQLNRVALVDLIVVMRGGGSLEDLWSFNTEIVVRAITASALPVVSAVGHEIDTTLSDFAADLRAPTPSAAAELIVWEKEVVRRELQRSTQQLGVSLRRLLAESKSGLTRLLQRPVWRRPEKLFDPGRQRLDQLFWRLTDGGKKLVEKPRHRLSLAVHRLEALSPLAILARGYSVTTLLRGEQVLRTVAALSPGDEIETILRDGAIRSRVTDIRKS